MLIPIDEVVHFDITTHDPSTGAETAADSTPTFDVFEEATDTEILDDQNFTLRTGETGIYRGTFTASAANGFEAGKWYIVIARATVNTVAAAQVAMHFRVTLAEAVAGIPKVDATYVVGDAQSALDLKDFADAGYDPSTNKVQGVVLTDTVTTYTGNTLQTGDAYAAVTAGVTVTTNNDKTGYALSAAGVDLIWDEVQSGHATAGSFGLYVDIASSTISSGGLTAATIADAVWDEAIADHLTSGTTGRKLNDLSIATISAGADECTLNVSVADEPIENAQCWVTTDSAGENVYDGTKVTDSDGNAVFLLDDGNTFYFWAQKSGVVSIMGEEFVAEADA